MVSGHGKGHVLGAKQRRFVEEYLVDLDAEAAARRAGYGPGRAARVGRDLLARAEVARAVRAAMLERAGESGLLAECVRAEWAAVAFADMADYLRFGEAGQALLDFARMPPGASRAVAEVTQDEYTEGRGEAARRVRRTRFKLHSKLAALDSLARHLGLFAERSPPAGREGERLYGVLLIPGASDEEAWAAAAAAQQDEERSPGRR